MHGEPPFSFTYETSPGIIHVVTGVQQASHPIPLTDSGTVTLLSVNDTRCQGTVELPNTCTVQLVGVPSLSLALEANPRGSLAFSFTLSSVLCFDICLNNPGCTRESIRVASINVTGEGPWELVYEETASVSTPKKGWPYLGFAP